MNLYPLFQKSFWIRLCLVIVLASLFFGSESSAQTVSVVQKKPGSVFIYPEQPEFALTVDGNSVQWSVTDFWNKTVATGTLSVSGGTATLTFDPGALGYFAVQLVAVKNGIPSNGVNITCAVLASVDPLAPRTPFGIATHFAQYWDVGLMDIIAKAGITRIRDENYWNDIEKATRGNYVFPSHFTNYMAAAQAKGIEPIMALTFRNSLYDDNFSPYTDDGRQGYANYSSRVVSNYGTQIKEVEVWNEYNGSFAPLPSGLGLQPPATYTAMLKKTFETLRINHPDVKVGGGAAVLVPLPWFENLFKLGALNYLDALVIHPYRGVPEGVETEVAALKLLTRTYNNGNEKPIWVTECGVDSADPGRQSMARYLVRLFTLLRSEGVERIHWYFLKDEFSFVRGLLYSDESSFGKNAPNTGYPTLAALIKIMGDASIVRRETTDLRTRIYLFNKNGTQLRVVWSTSDTSRILAQANGPLVVTDIMGNSHTVQPVDGYATFVVDQDPFYISGNIISLREIGRDNLLTDSAAGYSETQGTLPGSWQYGYEEDFSTNPPFRFFALTATRYGNRWEGGNNFASLRIDNAHPALAYPLGGGTPVQSTTIRRWLSNVSGPINITGFSRRSSAGGDGTGIAFRIDGIIIYSRIINPTPNDVVNFSLRAMVNVGSNVDFMVNPGLSTNLSFDAIDYALQISQPFAAGDIAGEPARDPDNDGLNNRLENALGSNPLKSDAAEMVPKLLVTTQPSGEKYLQFQYRYLQASGGLTYQVLKSDDLQNWMPASGITFNVQDNNDGTWLREFQQTQPASNKRSFLRLEVTPP